MSHFAVKVKKLADAIADLGAVFQTKDVSQHSSVRDGHPDLAKLRNYHAFIGKALMMHHAELGIVHVGESKPKGAIWRKQGAEAVPAAVSPDSATPQLADREATRRGLGPQCAADSAFQARMRRHQSWYREQILGLPYRTTLHARTLAD